jgi:hypothetical protein
MTDEASLVDRMARLLFWQRGGGIWSTLDLQIQDEYRRNARGVLEEMMLPDAWMIDEMCGEWARNPNDSRKLGEQMLAYWRAAIRGAMMEERGNPETRAIIAGTPV